MTDPKRLFGGSFPFQPVFRVVEVPERGSSPKVEVVTGGWVTSRFYRLLVIANLMLPAPVFGFDWF